MRAKWRKKRMRRLKRKRRKMRERSKHDFGFICYCLLCEMKTSPSWIRAIRNANDTHTMKTVLFDLSTFTV
ncbi:UNVERIFIED_CONTAM: hypothetical protein NCL1_14414 [Trichonephila clavipes]